MKISQVLLHSVLSFCFQLAACAVAAQAIEIGECVVLDPTGAATTWETGKVISKDASGYTIRMLGVGKYTGEYHVPEHYIHGYHKNVPAPAATAASSSPSYTPSHSQTPARAASPWSTSASTSASTSSGNTESARDSWKALSADIDERIRKSKAAAAAPPGSIGPAKAVSGSKGLSGLYLRHEQSFSGTSLSYREDHYLFFPDGRFYHGVPPEGPSNFNWAKEQSVHPELCGQYGINGNQITLAYSGSAPYTWPLKIRSANEMEMNMSPTVRVEKFGTNAKLSGNYQRGTTYGASYSYAGAPTVTAAGTYIFSPSGTVSSDTTKGIEGDTKITGVSVGIQQGSQGTYTINGNDMTMSLGGHSMRCTVYPIYDRGNSQLPARISINGALYERKK